MNELNQTWLRTHAHATFTHSSQESSRPRAIIIIIIIGYLFSLLILSPHTSIHTILGQPWIPSIVKQLLFNRYVLYLIVDKSRHLFNFALHADFLLPRKNPSRRPEATKPN